MEHILIPFEDCIKQAHNRYIAKYIYPMIHVGSKINRHFFFNNLVGTKQLKITNLTRSSFLNVVTSKP